jgi:hypothetical protein
MYVYCLRYKQKIILQSALCTPERLRGKLCSRNKTVWIFAAMLGSTNDQLLPPPVQMLIPLQHLIPDPKSLDYTIIPGVRAKSPDL